MFAIFIDGREVGQRYRFPAIAAMVCEFLKEDAPWSDVRFARVPPDPVEREMESVLIKAGEA